MVKVLALPQNLPGEKGVEVLAGRASEHSATALEAGRLELPDGWIIVDTDEGQLSHILEVVETVVAGLCANGELKRVGVQIGDGKGRAGEREVELPAGLGNRPHNGHARADVAAQATHAF